MNALVLVVFSSNDDFKEKKCRFKFVINHYCYTFYHTTHMQVSHHPPVAAHHCEGKAGWQLYQEFSMTSKFRGKYLSVIPTGVTHLHFAEYVLFKIVLL
jgi:hypothetical protein